MILLFWILVFFVLYSYIVYPVIILVAGEFFGRNKQYIALLPKNELPTITLLVTAYNEIDVVEQKIENSKALQYPTEKLKLMWVTDGSNDGTPEKVQSYTNINVLHESQRNGKIHAMNRAALMVDTEIIVFCDANTMLTQDTLLHIAKHFKNPKVGCVAGEKQVLNPQKSAAGTGEGLYWKYESWLKKLDYRLNTTLGAAGELFAIRKKLFNPVESDTVLDDFIISLRIAAAGYTVAYEPSAIATELPSFSIKEEMKRKIRIAAGGYQSLLRLTFLFNIFKHGWLSFQFISHKIFRWLICPLSMLLLIPTHTIIILQNPQNIFFIIAGIIHISAYTMALIGWLMETSNLKNSWFYLPYYFVSTNIAQIRGLLRYLKKSQPVNWEKARRTA